MGLAEIAPDPLLGRAAALMAYDRDCAAPEVADVLLQRYIEACTTGACTAPVVQNGTVAQPSGSPGLVLATRASARPAG